MALISTKTHAVGDYAGGALMIAASRLSLVRDRRAAMLLRVAGVSTLAASALTDYELGVVRKLPMRVHLTLDAVAGALMSAGALALRRTGAGAGSWVPAAAVGVGQLAGAAVTDRSPSDSASGGAAHGVPDLGHLSGEGLAAQQPASAGAPLAAAPPDTPGPSVNAPGRPESDVERAERVDADLAPDDIMPEGDDLVAQQEAAAAAEAAAIGGTVPSETGDPALDPVYQAGGGEQEGFETAEQDLVRNASHDDGHGDPARDAIAPEREADASTAVPGEADAEVKPD